VPVDGRGRRVALVAPADSYRLGAHLRAAAALGLATTVITDRPVGLPGSAVVVDLDAPADVAPALADLVADACVATDAAGLALAAELSAARGLRANPPFAVAAAADKGLQRRAAAGAGVRQPAFRLVGAGVDVAGAALEVGFPAVVKPLALTASQGVVRVEDPLDARAAARMVRELVGPEAPLLLERFLPGGEVALEGLLDDGRLHVLAIFDKPGAPQGPTFPETVLVAPTRLDGGARRALEAATRAVTAAVGLRHGPVHVEFRVGPAGRPWFLELAARTIGGRCAAMLRFAGGASLEELVLRQALGLPFDPTPEPGAIGVYMVPVERSGTVVAITGADAARSVEGIEEVVVDVAPGDRLVALPRGGAYPGFVFARSSGPGSVEAALAKARDLLRVEVRPD
jgi:biotin carboxylase